MLRMIGCRSVSADNHILWLDRLSQNLADLMNWSQFVDVKHVMTSNFSAAATCHVLEKYHVEEHWLKDLIQGTCYAASVICYRCLRWGSDMSSTHTHTHTHTQRGQCIWPIHTCTHTHTEQIGISRSWWQEISNW